MDIAKEEAGKCHSGNLLPKVWGKAMAKVLEKAKERVRVLLMDKEVEENFGEEDSMIDMFKGKAKQLK